MHLLILLALGTALADDEPKVSLQKDHLCVQPRIIGRGKVIRATSSASSGLQKTQKESRIATGRVDNLRDIYVSIALDDDCYADNGEVKVQVRAGTPGDPTALRTLGEVYIANDTHDDNRVLRSGVSMYDALTAAQESRVKALRDGELGDGASFDENLVFTWCEAQRAVGDTPAQVIVPCDATKITSGEIVQRTTNLSYTAEIGRDHQKLSMAVIAQPGRFMGVMVPCSIAQSYTAGGAVPVACEEGSGSAWAATAAASPIGAKLYYAPWVRYPWLGFSFSISASSIGVASVLSQLSTTASGEQTSNASLFTSPFDIALGIADMRVPGDARFDITPQVGLAVLEKGGALRAAPYFGVSMTTPLIEVFGSRFNGSKSATIQLSVDHPAVEPVTAALKRYKDALTALGDGRPWTAEDWSAGDVGKHLDDLASASTAAHDQIEALGDQTPLEKTRIKAQLDASAKEPLAELHARRSALDDALTKAEGAEAEARKELGLDDKATPTTAQQAQIQAEVDKASKDADALLTGLGGAATAAQKARHAKLPADTQPAPAAPKPAAAPPPKPAAPKKGG